MSPFREHYGAFDPETLALLEISFNETWTELQRNGGSFDPVSMRSFVADLLIEFAQQGETDPRRFKALTWPLLSSDLRSCIRSRSIVWLVRRRLVHAPNAEPAA
jgi:hypothetical protein